MPRSMAAPIEVQPPAASSTLGSESTLENGWTTLASSLNAMTQVSTMSLASGSLARYWRYVSSPCCRARMGAPRMDRLVSNRRTQAAWGLSGLAMGNDVAPVNSSTAGSTRGALLRSWALGLRVMAVRDAAMPPSFAPVVYDAASTVRLSEAPSLGRCSNSPCD